VVGICVTPAPSICVTSPPPSIDVTSPSHGHQVRRRIDHGSGEKGRTWAKVSPPPPNEPPPPKFHLGDAERGCRGRALCGVCALGHVHRATRDEVMLMRG
jgi:hypothetical protein